MNSGRLGLLTQRIFLYFAAIVGLAMAILTFLPIPPSQLSSFLSRNVVGVTLIVLSIMLGYSVEVRRQLDSDREQVVQLLAGLEKQQIETGDRIVSTLAGGPIVKLQDTVAVYRHVTDKLRSAKRYVFDLSWGPSITALLSQEELQAFGDYFAVKSAAIERGVPYQEVWTFPDELRGSRYRATAQLHRLNYQARYYDIDHKVAPPLLNFVMVDDEVILAFHSGREVRPNPEAYFATGNEIVRDAFAGYFNAIWQQAKQLEDDGTGHLVVSPL